MLDLFVATVTRMRQLLMKEFPVGKSSEVTVGKVHHFHAISYKWVSIDVSNPINFGATNFDTFTVKVGYSQW